jgi:hypothetical protein
VMPKTCSFIMMAAKKEGVWWDAKWEKVRRRSWCKCRVRRPQLLLSYRHVRAQDTWRRSKKVSREAFGERVGSVESLLRSVTQMLILATLFRGALLSCQLHDEASQTCSILPAIGTSYMLAKSPRVFLLQA